MNISGYLQAMGNVIPGSKKSKNVVDIQSSGRGRGKPLIIIDNEIKNTTNYGAKIVTKRQTSDDNDDDTDDSYQLIDLYPYLTYNGSINTISSSLTLLENIANIISTYAAIKETINKSFEFKVQINKLDAARPVNKVSYPGRGNHYHFHPPSLSHHGQDDDELFADILCGCSWKGMVYIVAPINHPNINAKLYMIDGGYFENSKQLEQIFPFHTSKYSLDPNFCCVISHIHNNNNTNNGSLNININKSIKYDPKLSMVIDGIIMVNSKLDTIYGLHLINNNNGLFILKRFNSEIKEISMLSNQNNDNPNDDIYNQESKEKNEFVINLWRQELDAFVLTSKFNLYGIRVQQNKFKFEKVCTFMEAVEDITNVGTYSNCWFDTEHKLLFLIFRNMKNNTVQFKMYESDRSKWTNNTLSNMSSRSDKYEDDESEDKNAIVVWDKHSDSKSMISDISSSIASSIDINIPHKLQNVLNQNYLSCNKSTLLYHKQTNTFLIYFGLYVVQLKVDFGKRILIAINIGNINEEASSEGKARFDSRKPSINRNAQFMANEFIANTLFDMNNDMNTKSIASEWINTNPLPPEKSICDHIIGFDEKRSCIILNYNESERELKFLYKFKVDIKRATDFASTWQSISCR